MLFLHCSNWTIGTIVNGFAAHETLSGQKGILYGGSGHLLGLLVFTFFCFCWLGQPFPLLFQEICKLTPVFPYKAIQLLGIVVVVVWSAFWTFVLLKCMEWTVGIALSPEEEEEGLDKLEHGEKAYYQMGYLSFF